MMTDEKIIKALECCEEYECKGDCPLINNPHCLQVLKNNALDLIKRQQAEIERYKTLYEDLKAENLETIKAIKDYKTEAIKEFAVKLKAKIDASVYRYWNYGFGGYYLAVDVDGDIDNLVKELTEGSNGE